MMNILLILVFTCVIQSIDCDSSTERPVFRNFNQTSSIVAQAFEVKRNLDNVRQSQSQSSLPSSGKSSMNLSPIASSSSSSTTNSASDKDNKNPISANSKSATNNPPIATLPNTTRIPQINNNQGSTSSSTNNDYCPAVKAPISNVYISYNPSYQAATLDEVVSYFEDPTVDDPVNAKTLTGVRADSYDPYKRSNANYICYTKECLGCIQILNDRLQLLMSESPNFNSVYHNVTAFSSANGMASLMGLSRGRDQLARFCKKLYHQQDSKNRVVKTVNVSGDELAKIVEFIKPHRGASRPRRDTSKPGTATKLDCNYRRGDQTNDSTNFAGLCNLCWTLRTLPSKYFPRFVNELSCDSNESSCLSGYGSCRERYRSIDVLYNYGTDDTPKWVQYSINTPVSCECRVQMGSALHNLVSR